MKLEDFYMELKNEVAGRAVRLESGSINSAVLRIAFVDYIRDLCESSRDLEMGEICSFYIQKGNRSGRIDAYSYDDETSILTIIISDLDFAWDFGSKINTKELESLKQEVVNALGMVSRKFLIDEVPTGSSNAETIKALLSSAAKVESIRIEIITNKILAIRKPLKITKNLFCDREVNLSTNIIDLQQIYNIALTGESRDDLIFDLEAHEIASAVVVPNNPSVLAAIPGASIARLYQQYGSRLLEKNVRSYLQAKGKVNKGILLTLSQNPEDFFSFNNGLTIICNDCVVENNRLIKILEPQIVNGGQTTASLFKAFESKADLSNVSIMAKVVKIGSRDHQFVSDVSKYSNTQNKISQADLFANDQFLVAMEIASKKIMSKDSREYYYFERSRGAYLTEMMIEASKKSTFEKRYPRNKKFTKEDYALAYNSWDKKPYFVSKGGQKNFSEFAKKMLSKKVEDLSIDEFKEEAGKVILFRLIKSIVYSQKDTIFAHRNHVTGYSMSVVSAINLFSKKKLIHIFDQNIINSSERLAVTTIVLKVYTSLMKIVGQQEPGGVFMKSETWIKVSKVFNIEAQSDKEIIRNIPLSELLELQTWVLSCSVGDHIDKGVVATIVGYAAQDWEIQGADSKPTDKQTTRFMRLSELFQKSK